MKPQAKPDHTSILTRRRITSAATRGLLAAAVAAGVVLLTACGAADDPSTATAPADPHLQMARGMLQNPDSARPFAAGFRQGLAAPAGSTAPKSLRGRAASAHETGFRTAQELAALDTDTARSTVEQITALLPR